MGPITLLEIWSFLTDHLLSTHHPFRAVNTTANALIIQPLNVQWHVLLLAKVRSVPWPQGPKVSRPVPHTLQTFPITTPFIPSDAVTLVPNTYTYTCTHTVLKWADTFQTQALCRCSHLCLGCCSLRYMHVFPWISISSLFKHQCLWAYFIG